MMSPQQQQILTRSALAAGVTLAVGLAAIGFVPGRTAGPVAPAAPEAAAGAVDARALADAGQGSTPDRAVVAAPGRRGLEVAAPVESPREVVYEDDEHEDEGRWERHGDHDEYEHDEDHEDDEHEDDDHEREGGWSLLRRAFSRERR